MKRFLLPALLAFTLAPLSPGADAPKPLKALLIAGGCCHDYAKQKDILKKGLEERANVVVDVVFSEDKSTKPPLAIYGNPDYAKGYDVIIHDECAADIKDAAVVDGVLKPHKDGIAGVNLHCGMHSYRTGSPVWFEYLGLQSNGHGPQEPIAITFSKDNAITKGLSDWKTVNEELYNNVKVFETAKPIAQGKQMVKEKEESAVVAWTNQYGKARVFSTTIGHNNATVEDGRYLDLVANGLLWACDKLDNGGKAKAGYSAGGK